MKRLATLALLAMTSAAQKVEEKPAAELEQVIDQKKIESMPLDDRRSMNMVGITGASVFVSYQHGGKASFSLAGGRTQSQSFMVDGGNGQSMRLGGGQMDFDPPSEALSRRR
jgi:hypothetical protein